MNRLNERIGSYMLYMEDIWQNVQEVKELVMEVSLSPKLEALVQEKKLAALRQAVQVGIDQADRGEFAEGFSIETLMKEADSGE